MSKENVEIVRRGFTGAMEEDWPTALDTLDPQVQIHDFDIPDAGTYRGHDGFLAWLENWGEGWESWRLENIEFRAAGEEQVIATFRMIATGGGSGVEVERDDAITYRLIDRRIVRMEYFNDQQKALEAVGLST
jgi:ketosteroid isomerase-like protein